MNAYEIFQQLPEDTSGEIFQYLNEKDKPAYRACGHLLSTRRNLRPVLFERKSRAERNAWMSAELGRKMNADAAIEVLQTWLLGAHQALICDFLDILKIPHNGNGLLETLPPEPPKADLLAAVDKILEKYPPRAVAIYLHLFCEMDIADWPTLKETLATDSRLCLNQPTLPA